MDFSQLLIPALVRLPLFLLWLVGIVLAISRWRDHPRVSIAVVSGIAILSIAACTSLLFTMSTPRLVSSFSENFTLLKFIFFLRRISPFIEFAGWILVLVAIFSGRRAMEQKPE